MPHDINLIDTVYQIANNIGRLAFYFYFIGFLAFVLITMLLYNKSDRFKGPEYSGPLDYALPKHLYRRPGTKLDLKLILLGHLLWRPAIGILVLMFATINYAHLLNSYFGPRGNSLSSGTVLAIQFIVTYLSSEFAGYWHHRLAHQNRFLWAGHKVHHSAEEMTFLTNGRDHPIDIIVTLPFTMFISAPLAALSIYLTSGTLHPMMPTMMLGLMIVAGIMDKFNHSHVPSSFGPLDRIFNSGHMHHIHHSAELRHRDKNFGATLSIFDWMFGTLYIPKAGETPILGLTEEEIGVNNPHKDLKSALTEPFVYFKNQMAPRARAEVDRDDKRSLAIDTRPCHAKT